MRRILAPLMAASLLMLLPALVSSATAAPVQVGKQIAPASCPNARGYPAHPNAMVEVSTSIVHVGDSFEASGVDYCPDENVRLTIAGDYVATAHTDGEGDFDPRLEAPGPPGPKRLCGVGASGRNFDRDCLTIHVRAAGGSSPAPPTPGGGGTAFTGVRIALFGLAALVLVVGGVVVTTLGRNRRPERA